MIIIIIHCSYQELFVLTLIWLCTTIYTVVYNQGSLLIAKVEMFYHKRTILSALVNINLWVVSFFCHSFLNPSEL